MYNVCIDESGSHQWRMASEIGQHSYSGSASGAPADGQPVASDLSTAASFLT